MISTKLELMATLKMLRGENFNPDLLQGLSDRIDPVLKIIDDYANQVKAIMSSPDFTEKGKQAQKAQLSRRTKDFLAAERFRAKDYADQISSLERKVHAKQLPAQDLVLTYLKEREIRDYFKGKDALELRVIYDTAGSEGNDLIQTALENAPIPLLPSEVTEAGKQARSMRLDPETAARIRDLQTVQRVFADTIRSAQAELGISDDVTARVASGETAA